MGVITDAERLKLANSAINRVRRLEPSMLPPFDSNKPTLDRTGTFVLMSAKLLWSVTGAVFVNPWTKQPFDGGVYTEWTSMLDQIGSEAPTRIWTPVMHLICKVNEHRDFTAMSRPYPGEFPYSPTPTGYRLIQT